MDRISNLSQESANIMAWNEGVDRLQEAMSKGHPHALETTLGGRTMTDLIAAATKTHDVFLWFCGLSSVDQHIARVQARVTAGGHDIPTASIRFRYHRARGNVLRLMPYLAGLRVYDNSIEIEPGKRIPEPKCLIEMEDAVLLHPDPKNPEQLEATPTWARALLEGAIVLHEGAEDTAAR